MKPNVLVAFDDLIAEWYYINGH